MPYIGYAFILLVCLGVILVCFNKVNQKAYPLLLYPMGAGIVLITTLAGSYLVGGDIHLDYYYALLRGGVDVWAPQVGTPQGTSIVSYWGSSIWLYKVVYPLLFALIPVILYYVWRKWLSPKEAFIASFLFIAFPIFFLELPTIPRQMLAEVLLALVLFFIVKSTLRLEYKLPILVPLGTLIPLIHYSIAIVATILLGVGLLVSIIWSRDLWKSILVTFLVVILTSSIYFPLAEDGAVLRKVGHLYNIHVPVSMQIKVPPLQMTPGFIEPPEPPTIGGIPSFLKGYEALVQVGLGADLMQVSTLGKIFRILQWGVLLLVGVGLWKLRRKKGYWVFASGATLISLLCLVPGWSPILNATRFVHLSLFLVAPAFAVALKPRYLLVFLIPYFLFTSGFIFEATKFPNVDRIEIPYSIGLSDHRMDLGATFTKDDIKVREYILSKMLFPLNSDMWGAYFMLEKTGEVMGINRELYKDPKLFPLEGYIFVRSRNAWDGTFTVWNGIGCRKYMKPETYGIDWNENIIFQSGDSRVLGVK